MDGERAAAGLGVLGAAATVALVVYPYTVGSPAVVGAYYAVGPAGPPLLATFGVIAALALLAGVRRRSDPALTAGVAIVIAAFMTGLGTWWALAVPSSLVGEFGPLERAWQASVLSAHRWLVVAAAGLTLLGAAWYARRVL